MEILYDILEIGTSFVMLHIPTPNYLPILSLQQFLDLVPSSLILLSIPSLKEPHFTIKKRPMRILRSRSLNLPNFLTLRKHSRSSIEDSLNRVEPITREIP